MYLTGFADEAAADIAGQIKATKELKWEHIELRNIDGESIATMSDRKFEELYAALNESGININCFGSPIANSGEQITKPFADTVTMIKTSIPRMQKLNCRMVRIMSYAVLPDKAPEEQLEKERFTRVRQIKEMFDDAGILPVHENCTNYCGMGWTYTQRLLDSVPGLKLLFDTGNPVFTDDWSKEKPYPKQSAWEFYSKIKEHIAYIHIKDGIWNNETGQVVFTYAGEGEGDVKKIVADMLHNGYDGGISIEPHLGPQCQENEPGSDDDKKYRAYIRYGQRFMKLLKEIQENT